MRPPSATRRQERPHAMALPPRRDVAPSKLATLTSFVICGNRRQSMVYVIIRRQPAGRPTDPSTSRPPTSSARFPRYYDCSSQSTIAESISPGERSSDRPTSSP
ncbi:hypothetical protein KIN20_005832 [Parelaphostrongylus tenuis]|uniref:Uncharacterized protein n=1 Tax=Parelaphostrongylus tenuis TaxID=148309 RepID=A0AAD5MTA3_PARTN|nr:hypothetical protein KIN20_005832 [Parelaphostrongylus tenuis]